MILVGTLALTACGGDQAAPPTTTTVVHHRRPVPANVVRIHWRKESLVPAARAGHICITTYRLGHFCASYKLGEIPANALRRKLRRRHLVVQTIP